MNWFGVEMKMKDMCVCEGVMTMNSAFLLFS